jgi:hypothetical protein
MRRLAHIFTLAIAAMAAASTPAFATTVTPTGAYSGEGDLQFVFEFGTFTCDTAMSGSVNEAGAMSMAVMFSNCGSVGGLMTCDLTSILLLATIQGTAADGTITQTTDTVSSAHTPSSTMVCSFGGPTCTMTFSSITGTITDQGDVIAFDATTVTTNEAGSTACDATATATANISPAHEITA